MQLTQPDFWAATFQTAAINILLSSDNALAIALACRDLPSRERHWSIVFGTALAVIMTVIFAGTVSILMRMPYLQLGGGLALLYIASTLDEPDIVNRDVERAHSIWRAARTIAVANIVMSFDNVIAIAAAAKGNIPAIFLGLAFSIPLVVAAANLLVVMLNRFPILVWGGAGLLGWIAGSTIATDAAVAASVQSHLGATAAESSEIAFALAGVLLVGVSHYWRRQRALSRRT